MRCFSAINTLYGASVAHSLLCQGYKASVKRGVRVDELSEFEEQVVYKHDLIEMRGKVSIIYFSIRKIEREKALAGIIAWVAHRIDERLEELQQHMQYLNMDKKAIQITFSRVFKTAHDSGQSPERIHSIQCIRIVRNRILADIEDTCKISIVISPLLWYNKRVMKSR